MFGQGKGIVKNKQISECYSAIRKDEYPPFASTWMELEGIMLSEISQLEKDKRVLEGNACWFSNAGTPPGVQGWFPWNKVLEITQAS